MTSAAAIYATSKCSRVIKDYTTLSPNSQIIFENVTIRCKHNSPTSCTMAELLLENSSKQHFCLEKHPYFYYSINSLKFFNKCEGAYMKNKIFILLLAGLLLTGCGQETNQSQNSSNTSESTSKTGATNPFLADSESTAETEAQEPYILTFEATTIEGEEMTSDIFADSKLTMINIWATYCNPCLIEMPDLGEIATEYDKTDFQMIGIISDVTTEADDADITAAKDLIEDTKATTYPHLLLNQSLYYNLVGATDSVPTTFFVNQKGELLGYLVGSQSKDTWVAIIEDLLSELE